MKPPPINKFSQLAAYGRKREALEKNYGDLMEDLGDIWPSMTVGQFESAAKTCSRKLDIRPSYRNLLNEMYEELVRLIGEPPSEEERKRIVRENERKGLVLMIGEIGALNVQFRELFPEEEIETVLDDLAEQTGKSVTLLKSVDKVYAGSMEGETE